MPARPRKSPAKPRILKPIINLNGQPVEITYGNDAVFRLQSLPQGAPLITSAKAFYAACCWVWGMLPESLQPLYPNPGYVAKHLVISELPDTIAAIGDAIDRSKLPADSAKKV
jgi:hypothetical protein